MTVDPAVARSIGRALDESVTAAGFAKRVEASFGPTLLPYAYALAQQVRGPGWWQLAAPAVNQGGSAEDVAGAEADSSFAELCESLEEQAPNHRPAAPSAHAVAPATVVVRRPVPPLSQSSAQPKTTPVEAVTSKPPANTVDGQTASAGQVLWNAVKAVLLQPTGAVLALTAVAFVVALLFPPWVIRAAGETSRVEMHVGFSYLTEPPESLATVDLGWLAIELVGIGLAGAMAYVMAQRIERQMASSLARQGAAASVD